MGTLLKFATGIFVTNFLESVSEGTNKTAVFFQNNNNTTLFSPDTGGISCKAIPTLVKYTRKLHLNNKIFPSLPVLVQKLINFMDHITSTLLTY